MSMEMKSAQLLQGLSEAVQSLSSGMTRLEEGQQQLAQSLDQKLGTLQSTLNDKLDQLGGEQEVLRLDLDELCVKQERVEEDTATLKETVQQLTSKLERLDTEQRKPNLLFFGVANRVSATCEQLIKEVFQQQLNITTDILIEYAYWTGNAILVRFQSLKQRGLVLTQARQLPASSRLSIREDFSKEVSNRRKGLVAFYKELRSEGRRATLRADRLFSDDGIYSFHIQRQEIIRVGEPSDQRRYQHSQVGNKGAGGSSGAAASAHHATNNRADDSGRAADVPMEGTQTVDADPGTGGGVEWSLAPFHRNSAQEQQKSALGEGWHSRKHLNPRKSPQLHSRIPRVQTGQHQPSLQSTKRQGDQASQAPQGRGCADQPQSQPEDASSTVPSSLVCNTTSSNMPHTQQHTRQHHTKNSF
ncbi:hypothetical protein ACOMHN_052048 [Nucella lapillus]